MKMKEESALKDALHIHNIVGGRSHMIMVLSLGAVGLCRETDEVGKSTTN